MRIVHHRLVPLYPEYQPDCDHEYGKDPAPHIAPVPLYSASDAVEALTLKQARRIQPAGKRHGKGFALGLSIYAGLSTAARLDVRDIDRQPQGDRLERARLSVIGAVREQWGSIAPKCATEKHGGVLMVSRDACSEVIEYNDGTVVTKYDDGTIIKGRAIDRDD